MKFLRNIASLAILTAVFMIAGACKEKKSDNRQTNQSEQEQKFDVPKTALNEAKNSDEESCFLIENNAFVACDPDDHGKQGSCPAGFFCGVSGKEHYCTRDGCPESP